MILVCWLRGHRWRRCRCAYQNGHAKCERCGALDFQQHIPWTPRNPDIHVPSAEGSLGRPLDAKPKERP